VSATDFEALGDDRDAVLAMLAEGSFDPEVLASSYLPPRMDLAGASRYAATARGLVLRLDGRPVGIAVALAEPSPGEGVEVPAGSVELDMWLLAPERGQGMRWFGLIKAWMAERHDHLVGVTWSRNTTAVALLRWSGWRHLGRSHWRCDAVEGACEVFVYDLAAWRAAQTREA